MAGQTDGTTADPVKEVEAVEATDAAAEVEGPKTDYKGKGKKKEESEDEEEDEDDDDEDEDEDDEDDDDDDEDDIPMDEVDLNAIIPPSSRRSARSGQIDYSSEEALKKAGLVSAAGDEVATSTNEAGADDEEDDDFKGDETMDDDE